MMNDIKEIATFVLDSFLHIWPYLLITIPLAVLVQLTGAAKYIKKVLNMNPFIAIILATVVGAFSPFCSCGVIPVIASLLLAGVPLAPVMSFWIASPSMDPEIIFLSAATIGWKLTWWRLAATLIISLSAGFITHFAVNKKFIGENILKTKKVTTVKSSWELLKQLFIRKKRIYVKRRIQLNALTVKPSETVSCCVDVEELENNSESCDNNTNSCECTETSKKINEKKAFTSRLLDETYKATLMVIKFMGLAFILTAIIQVYVPSNFIADMLGGDSGFNIIMASIIGIPFYTSNLTALPLVGGLISQGMNPAAALAFLIAGPTTTLPAMAAVWGIVNKKVFLLYVSFSLIGALFFGYLGLLFL